MNEINRYISNTPSKKSKYLLNKSISSKFMNDISNN